MGAAMHFARITITLAAMLILAAAPLSAQRATTSQPVRGPLTLKEQGTFFVGGTTEWREPNTSSPSDDKYVPGEIAVNQMYVEYQVPEPLKYRYPIVMLHGGGHSGNVYRTTPDGREGWFTSFARRGFAVYVVDAPNRGRSGWDPTNRFAVSSGQKPVSALEAANIYSAQNAWVSFRIGPTYGSQYPGQQFPTDKLGDYLPQLVPSYRDPIQNDYIVRDLQALIDRIGPCILLGWSTGSGNAMVAGTSRTDRVKGIIAIETVPPNPARSKVDEATLAKIPFVVVIGDHEPETAKAKAYTDKVTQLGGDATTISLPEGGIMGNGHAMMLERNNEQIADIIEKWIVTHVKEP
jgi:pimeloyl-ACP methyl ester carboxylesterase